MVPVNVVDIPEHHLALKAHIIYDIERKRCIITERKIPANSWLANIQHTAMASKQSNNHNTSIRALCIVHFAIRTFDIFHRCIFVSMHCSRTTMLINSSDCKIKENNKWENFSTLKSILYALNRNTNSKRSIHSFISNWWSRERPFESFYGGCCCSARVLLPSSMFMCGLAPKKKHTTTTDISNIFSLQNIRYLWCFLGNSVLLC